MNTETTNKKIKIDNGTTFGKTYTDKAVDERLQGLVSTATFTPVQEKANNSLQKPAGLTKTELVGVGTNGQENIEIGDNLTLANGKLSATGGGGEEFNELILNNYLSDNDLVEIAQFILNSYDNVGTSSIYKEFLKEVSFSNNKPIKVIIDLFGNNIIYYAYKELTGYGISYFMTNGWSDTGKVIILGYLSSATNDSTAINRIKFYVIGDIQKPTFSHFITMTDSNSNVALYLTIQDTNESHYIDIALASYLVGKKVLVNGNLHGVVPTYISGEGGVIKIYYRTPGDSNINPTPDEYQDLSSFTITDLVTPVE